MKASLMRVTLVTICLILTACGKVRYTEYIKEDFEDRYEENTGITEIIDPCGDHPNKVDEILFRLWTGEIAAWYKDTGFVILEPGDYVTTDKQKCYFTITVDGEVIES